MNCGKAHRWMALAVSDDLPLYRSRRLHQHLQACDACQQFWQNLVRLREDLQHLRQDPLDLEDRDRWRASVIKSLPGEVRPRYFGRWYILGPIVAGSMVLLILGITMLWQAHFASHPSPSRSEPGPGRAQTSSPVTTPGTQETFSKAPHMELFAMGLDLHLQPPQPVSPRPRAERSVGMALKHLAAARHPDQRTQPSGEEAKPSILKILTADPDVLIVWILEENHGGQ